MAGDWIKWSKGLIDKPEVIRIAGMLGASREVVVCRLMKFWEWCDANIPDADIRENGSAFVTMSPRDGDNVAFVDALVWTPGFADSLAAVDWLRCRDGRLELPNFGRHNGETAKTRARNAKNQKRKRQEGGGEPAIKTAPEGAPPSPQMSPRGGDKPVTRGEERREERQKTEDPPTPRNGGTPRKARKKADETAADAVPIPAAIDTPEVRAAWGEWLACRRAKHKPVSERAAVAQLAGLATLTPAQAVACITASIANDWQGLFPEKYRGDTGPPRRGFQTRTEELFDQLSNLDDP